MQQQAAALAEVVGIFKLEAQASRTRGAAHGGHAASSGIQAERLLARS
jgi:hypothetical protein